MSQFDKDLKMYAENGLRTAEDWLSIGRQVESNSKPRSSAALRGHMVDLFTRDQTQPRQLSERRQG